MNKKTVVLASTCLVLAAASLTACGDSKPESGGGDSGGGKQAANKTIRVLTTDGGNVFATQAPAAEKDKYYKELNRISGFDVRHELLTWGGGADYNQQLALRFAIGEMSDLMMTNSIYSNVHAGAVDQNVFLPLDELIAKHGKNLKSSIPEVAWNSPRVKKNGVTYGIPIVSAAPASRVIFIRQDWLKKLNIEAPKTLDDFLKFAEGVKKNDMNGDGNPDNEYALALTDNLGWNDVFTGSFGVRPDAWQLRNGRLEPDFIQPQMKEAIAFYKKLYDNGYIHKDFVTKKQSDRMTEIYKGYFGAYGAAANQYRSFTDKAKYVNQPDAETIMIAPPKGPRGEAYFEPQSEQIDFVWVIPSKTKNPEEVIQYLDWAWGSEEGKKYFAFGIKDHNYKEEGGKVVFDADSPVNTENGASGFFQKTINPKGSGSNTGLLMELVPEAEIMKNGYKAAESAVYKHASMGMPQLESLTGRPELEVNLGANTLFYDAFVKLVVGKEDLDAGFDKFVKEWKSRGGEAVIKEATDWYNSKGK